MKWYKWEDNKRRVFAHGELKDPNWHGSYYTQAYGWVPRADLNGRRFHRWKLSSRLEVVLLAGSMPI